MNIVILIGQYLSQPSFYACQDKSRALFTGNKNKQIKINSLYWFKDSQLYIYIYYIKIYENYFQNTKETTQICLHLKLCVCSGITCDFDRSLSASHHVMRNDDKKLLLLVLYKVRVLNSQSMCNSLPCTDFSDKGLAIKELIVCVAQSLAE